MNKIIRRVALISNAYLFLSILYFFFGRYKWDIPSNEKLIIYFIILMIFLNLGFFLGTGRNDAVNSVQKSHSNFVNTIFVVSMISIIIYQVSWVVVILGKFDIITIISNLGSNYIDRLDGSTDDISLLMQLRTLTWGITLFAYPIGFYRYKQLNIKIKMLFIFTLLIDIMASLNMGISKNIGDIVIIFLVISLIKSKKISNRIYKIATVLALFVVIFGAIQIMRDKSYGYDQGNNQIEFVNSTNRNTTIVDIITLNNRTLSSVIDRFGFYISHGYAGLAYSLELGHENTFGIGISRALMEYFDSYLGISVQQNTYVYRIDTEYGWPNGIYWSTAFVWVAASFGFLLTPLFIMVFGFSLTNSIKRFLLFKDIFSLTLSCVLFIQIVYLPANLQILQSRPSFFGTITIVVAYLFTSKRVKKNDKFSL